MSVNFECITLMMTLAKCYLPNTACTRTGWGCCPARRDSGNWAFFYFWRGFVKIPSPPVTLAVGRFLLHTVMGKS